MEDEKEKLLEALSDPKYSWRTVDGVSRDTGIKPAHVQELVQEMPDLVIRSRIPNKRGEALYATRAHYKRTHSPIARLLDQFRSTKT